MSIFDLFGYFFQHFIDTDNTEKNINKPTTHIERQLSNENNIKEIPKKNNTKRIITSYNNSKISELKPYKDYLFRYIGWTIKSEYNGDIKYIDYDMKRDIEDRDEIDVDKVFDKYVNILPKSYSTTKSYQSKYWTEYYWEVKNPNDKNTDIKLITIYFHWMWWNYHQWFKDYTFWWNFNRIKNLMVNNHGVYISAWFTDFYTMGTEDMRVLLRKLKKEYPNAKIILSWASSGWTLLWNIMKDPELEKEIYGIILLGSVIDLKTDIYRYNIPIYIAHWTRDPLIWYRTKYQFYDYLKKYNPNYPIKIEFFVWWIHWTPIRMADWKKYINYIINYNETKK